GFVEDSLDLPAAHAAHSWLGPGHASVAAHGAAPGDQVVDGEPHPEEHLVHDGMDRMVPLAAQTELQGIAPVPQLLERGQARAGGDPETELVELRQYGHGAHRDRLL